MNPFMRLTAKIPQSEWAPTWVPFAPGGRRRKCGNVSIYLPAGDVWIVGNLKARNYLRSKIADWTVPA